MLSYRLTLYYGTGFKLPLNLSPEGVHNMKNLIFALALIISGNVFAADSQYQLGVNGLACPFCVYGLEKQLSKLPGVKQVETNVKKGEVVLLVKEGITLTEDSAREAVKKSGFSLRSFNQLNSEQ